MRVDKKKHINKNVLLIILSIIFILATSCRSNGDEEAKDDFGIEETASASDVADSVDDESSDDDDTGGNSGPYNTSTGGAELIAAGGCPQTLGLGETTAPAIRVVAVNSLGDPIEGASISFSLSGSIGGSISSISETTDINGIASITYTAAGSDGTAIVTASSLQGSIACSITVESFGDYTIAKYDSGNTDAQSGDINSALTNDLKILVTESAVPVSGVSVSFEILTGDGSVAGSNTTTAITNSSGIATGAWTLGPDVGAQSVKATIVGDATETVTFTGTGVANFDLGTSTIDSNATTMTAYGATGDDQTTTVTLTLKNGGGNAVALATGQTVAFSSTQGTFYGSVVDGGDGTYTQSFRASTTTGTATVSATVNTVAVTDTHDITIDHGALDLSESTFTIGQAALPPDGSSTTTLQVNLVDSLGNVYDDATTVAISMDSGTGNLAVTSSDGSGRYSALLTAPGSAGNAQFSAIANSSSVGSQIEIVYADLAGTTINCTNGNYATWANKDLYVSGGTLTINNYDGASGAEVCAMTFRSITIGTGGIITTETPTTSDVGGIQITVTNDLIIEGTGKIDLDETGYPAVNNEVGYTVGLTQTGGSEKGSWKAAGASHGGFGGFKDGTLAPNLVYGSASNPLFPGASGGAYTALNRSGGGVVRISATNIVNNGVISVNGGVGEYYGGSAGGSIYLNVSGTITGAGTFEAKGGDGNGSTGSGGGGRIAFYGDDTAISLGQIDVSSGPKTSFTNSAAGGTFYRSLGAYEGVVTLTSDLSLNYGDSPAVNIFSSDTELTIANGAVLTSDIPLTLSSLKIETGGAVTHSYYIYGLNEPKVDLTIAGILEVESGATINTNEKGWPDNGLYFNSTSCGLGIGGACSSPNGKGGNHYTLGAKNINATWGDPNNPDTYGGAGLNSSGGGIIKINCGSLILSGVIQSLGENHATYSADTGAGGSISIAATDATYNAGNSITVKGGNAIGTAASSGAGGLIYLDIGSSSGTISTNVLSGDSTSGGTYLGNDGVLTIAP